MNEYIIFILFLFWFWNRMHTNKTILINHRRKTTLKLKKKVNQRQKHCRMEMKLWQQRQSYVALCLKTNKKQSNRCQWCKKTTFLSLKRHCSMNVFSFIAIFVGVTAFYYPYTYERNFAWSSHTRLWESAWKINKKSHQVCYWMI